MFFKRFAIILFFGTIASLAYGAASIGGTELQPLDNQTVISDVDMFKDITNTLGSNSIAARRLPSHVGNTNPAHPGLAAPVPEPSATILLALGLAGFVLLKGRRASRR